MRLTAIGLDLAKNVFQVHGVDERGVAVLRKQLKRDQVVPFFARLQPCLVGIEACGGAHYWAGKLAALGHTVKMMAPQFVKPYVKTNKNDSLACLQPSLLCRQRKNAFANWGASMYMSTGGVAHAMQTPTVASRVRRFDGMCSSRLDGSVRSSPASDSPAIAQPSPTLPIDARTPIHCSAARTPARCTACAAKAAPLQYRL